MKRALGIWTAICLGIVVVTFLAAPGWQTEAEGWSLFSGAEIFVAVASLTVAAWIVGIGVIVGIGAVLRRVSPRAAIVILVLFLAALVLAVGVYVSGDGGETGSSFVAFNTVDGDPDWSPKGRSIAFATNRGSGGVYVVRPDGTAMRSLFRGEASDVDWSPDGKAIAFTGKGGIYVLDVRDGSARLVVRGSAFSLPAWAPNGRELAVVKEESGVYRTYNGRITATSPAVYVVRLDGGELRRLLPWYRGAVGDARPGSIAAVSETEPAWSPDGTRIAFQAGDGQIVAAHVESGRRVTINRAKYGYEPAWSPDGRLIAYQCAGDVCVANADGSGNEHRVASGGGDPSWSADSRLLVFERYLYGGTFYGSSPRSLSIVDANGDDLRALTYGPSS